MHSHGLEERYNSVIKDSHFVGIERIGQVLLAQVTNQVAREHAVEALKEDVEADLEVAQMIIWQTFRIILNTAPRGQISEYLKQIGEDLLHEIRDDGQERDNAQ